jgi:hypothetical protein
MNTITSSSALDEPDVAESIIASTAGSAGKKSAHFSSDPEAYNRPALASRVMPEHTVAALGSASTHSAHFSSDPAAYEQRPAPSRVMPEKVAVLLALVGFWLFVGWAVWSAW